MKKTPIVKILTIILMSLGGIGIVGGGFFLSSAFGRQDKPQATSNISDYKNIRNQVWLNPTEVNHFPVEILSADQVKGFIYSPASSTDGSALQLRLQKNPVEVKQLLTHYRRLAKAKYYGGNINEHLQRDRGLPTTFFYTDNNENDDAFPASYEVLVLGAQNKGTADFPWSHGNSYGVAIDPHRGEIVYWAEVW